MESGWNVWLWLVVVVVRRYIDFLILLIPTPLVSVLFCSSIPTFIIYFYVFRSLYIYFQHGPLEFRYYLVSGDGWPINLMVSD